MRKNSSRVRGAALCLLPAWSVDKTRAFHSGWIRQHPSDFVWFRFHCSSTIDGSCALFACTSRVLGLSPVLQRFRVASRSPSRSIHPRFHRLELPSQFLVFPDVFFLGWFGQRKRVPSACFLGCWWSTTPSFR